MALVQQTFLYEVLARFTSEGMTGCHKIDMMQIVDDATTPPTILSSTMQGAVAISQQEAGDLIWDATLAPPPEPEPEEEQEKTPA